MKIIENTVYKVLLCLLVICLLTGCEFSFFSPQDTIRAPRATGFYEGVQQALEAAVGSNIILKYPSTGGERSAFSVHDIDNDGVEEVLAFYQLRAEGEVTRMNLLCYSDDHWVSVQDFAPVGNDLVKIEYTDLDGDGTDEIIAGWSVSTSNSNQLVIYSYQKGHLVQRASEGYTNYTLCDIDNNGKQELGIVQLDKTNKTSKMNFYSFTSSKMTVVGSVSLDGNVTSYSSILVGKVSENVTAIYLDGYKDTNKMITELIYYDGSKIVNPFYDTDKSLTTVTLRYQQFFCNDIDENGIIDIPFSQEVVGYSAMLISEKQYLIKWEYFDGSVCKETSTVWYSSEFGYYIDFDHDWEKNMTVTVYAGQNTVVFNLWNSETNTKGEDVFRIRRFGAGEWETNPLDAYSVVYTNSQYVWAVSPSDISDSNYKVGLAEIMLRFHLISS